MKKVKLRPYQKEAVKETDLSNRGIICLPTGTGKTFIQAAIIANDIRNNPQRFNMYIVNAPRIILTYQLLKEIYGFLMRDGVEARYMFVHSGGATDVKELEDIRLESNVDGNNIPFSEIGNGTSTESILDMMNKARSQNLPVIFLSTYNSADRIEMARILLDLKQPISIVLNDEAHYLVQEQFHDILHTITSCRLYFFTATRVHMPGDNGRGMNNRDAYGELLYEMVPRRAIDMGLMVKPRIHLVNTPGVHSTDDYDTSINRIIKEAFAQHRTVIKKGHTPKLLISMRGTGDMIAFLASDEYRELRAEGVNVYAVSSNEDVSNDVNGEKTNRQNFLRIIKADGADDSKSMLVMHYDILAEGIDISGFTGIMPLRSLSKSKFMQTFGRAARLDQHDKQAIANKEIKPTDLRLMHKPYAYIIMPNVAGNTEDDVAYFRRLIEELRTYGFDTHEDIITTGVPNGAVEPDAPEGMNDQESRRATTGELITMFEAEFEHERIANLTAADYMREHLNGMGII